MHYGLPDGYDFSNGCDVSDEDIRMMIGRGIKHLDTNVEMEYYHSTRGRVLVFITRNDIDDPLRYNVCVTKSYVEFDVIRKECSGCGEVKYTTSLSAIGDDGLVKEFVCSKSDYEEGLRIKLKDW